MKAGFKIGLSKEDKQNMANDVYNRADAKITPQLNAMHETIQSLGGLKPSGVDSASNILSYTENKGVYVANDTGGWYYWNGSSYVYGGRFQSDINAVDLGEIIPESTIEETMKKIHIKIEEYTGIQNSDNSQKVYMILLADKDGSYGTCFIVKDIWTGDCYITYFQQENIKKYRTGYTSDDDTLACEEIFLSNIANGSVTPEKTTFIETSRNLFNINDSENINGKYLNRGTGKEVENSAYSISHYIEATPNEIFICNKNIYSYAWYTADKTLLYGSTTGFNAGVPFNISANTSLKYIRICTLTSDLNGLQFERGNEVTQYKEYGVLEIPNLKIESTKTFYVGSNREIKTLKKGIEEATKIKNATLYVEEGTYDLVSEFGQDYLDNTTTDKGLILKNNVHIIFSSRAKVVFNYTGNNSFIHREFSPFNSGIYGFTLENLTLECSNCRYAIHDERGGSTDTYHNRYLNMKITIDNSNNPNWTNSHNIGGGLGNDGYIEVVGNLFNHAVTYHNNNNIGYTSSKSKVIIKDNYFSTGGVGCQGYGASTEITEFLVVNNTIDWLSINTSNAQNINVVAFNNIIKYPS